MKTFYYEVLNLQTERDFGERCDALYYEVLHLQTLSDEDHALEDFVFAFRVVDDYLFSPYCDIYCFVLVRVGQNQTTPSFLFIMRIY